MRSATSVPRLARGLKPGRAARVDRGLHRSRHMLIVLGVLFLVAWLLLKLVWNVAAFGVHLLLAAAVIAIIVHFVRSRGAAP